MAIMVHNCEEDLWACKTCSNMVNKLCKRCIKSFLKSQYSLYKGKIWGPYNVGSKPLLPSRESELKSNKLKNKQFYINCILGQIISFPLKLHLQLKLISQPEGMNWTKHSHSSSLHFLELKKIINRFNDCPSAPSIMSEIKIQNTHFSNTNSDQFFSAGNW